MKLVPTYDFFEKKKTPPGDEYLTWISTDELNAEKERIEIEITRREEAKKYHALYIAIFCVTLELLLVFLLLVFQPTEAKEIWLAFTALITIPGLYFVIGTYFWGIHRAFNRFTIFLVFVGNGSADEIKDPLKNLTLRLKGIQRRLEQLRTPMDSSADSKVN
jgi:hypothetical protein